MRSIFRKVAISYTYDRPWLNRCRRWFAIHTGRLIWCMVLLSLSGCSRGEDAALQKTALIRSDQQIVTTGQFERAFSVARIAYSDDPSVDPLVLQKARLRLLHQMTEEVIVRRRAEELGIVIDDQELETAIRKIKQDYPDGEFKQMLLESAVPYSLWKERFKMRLLMGKVIDQDLVSSQNITATEIETYYKAHEDEFAVDEDEVPKAALKHRIIEQIRHEKVEAAYPKWINGLRKRYGVEINWALWERTYGSDDNNTYGKKKK
jgi:hypothetical protein